MEYVNIDYTDRRWHDITQELPAMSSYITFRTPDGLEEDGQFVVEPSGHYVALADRWGSLSDYSHWRFRFRALCHQYENEWPWGKTIQFICTDGLGTVEISREYQNNYAYISGLKVHPSVQKQGRGIALLKLAEQQVVKSLGTNIILLQVIPGSWVEEWYKRNGYCAFSKLENFNELIKIVKV